jgi:hypothetical protein
MTFMRFRYILKKNIPKGKVGMKSRLPINKRWIAVDGQGRICICEVHIEQTSNKTLYPPDGVKSVFKVKREKTPGGEDFEAVILIDNHEPFGFHVHSRLPEQNDFRETIHVSSWQEAWIEFEEKIEEILNET